APSNAADCQESPFGLDRGETIAGRLALLRANPRPAPGSADGPWGRKPGTAEGGKNQTCRQDRNAAAFRPSPRCELCTYHLSRRTQMLRRSLKSERLGNLPEPYVHPFFALPRRDRSAAKAQPPSHGIASSVPRRCRREEK